MLGGRPTGAFSRSVDWGLITSPSKKRNIWFRADVLSVEKSRPGLTVRRFKKVIPPRPAAPARLVGWAVWVPDDVGTDRFGADGVPMRWTSSGVSFGAKSSSCSFARTGKAHYGDWTLPVSESRCLQSRRVGGAGQARVGRGLFKLFFANCLETAPTSGIMRSLSLHHGRRQRRVVSTAGSIAIHLHAIGGALRHKRILRSDVER
jgi:hypothetical protein